MPWLVWPDVGIESCLNFIKNCSKRSLTTINLKWMLSKCLQKSQNFELFLWENLSPRAFKNWSIWSHWQRLYISTSHCCVWRFWLCISSIPGPSRSRRCRKSAPNKQTEIRNGIFANERRWIAQVRKGAKFWFLVYLSFFISNFVTDQFKKSFPGPDALNNISSVKLCYACLEL